MLFLVTIVRAFRCTRLHLWSVSLTRCRDSLSVGNSVSCMLKVPKLVIRWPVLVLLVVSIIFCCLAW